MNNSPIAQSPLSAGSTPGLAPKPASGGTPVTKIVTSKEWVLPPRPKPGRKPSADTPATKRKAQNRAAQRAFRERRATRVAELEQKLSEVEKEREVSELNWKNSVTKLQMENKFLINALNDIKNDYAQLKQMMTQQQQPNVLPHPNATNITGSHPSPASAIYSNGTMQAPSPLNYYKPSPQPQHQQQQYPHQTHQTVNQDYRFPQQAKQQHHHSSVSPAMSSPHDQSTAKTSVSSQNGDDDQYDCGVCVKDDCICAQVGIKPSQPQTQPQQIPVFENMAPVALKRKATDETDFTSQFAKGSGSKNVSKPMPKFKKFKKVENSEVDDPSKEFMVFDGITDKDFESPIEQCGFCSDDSPCVCREAAKEAANAITELQNHSKRETLAQQAQKQHSQQLHGVQPKKRESVGLPPISRHSSVSGNKLPVLHPGPTVEISEAHRSSITGTPTDTTSMSSSNTKQNGGCTGNPGTCTQCQLDPMSTLFCTTVASKSEAEEHQKLSLSANTSVKNSRRGSFVKMESSSGEASTTAVASATTPSVTTTTTTTSTSTSQSKDATKKSPVSPPLSNPPSKVSSPITTLPDEELNSLVKRAGQTLDMQTPGGGHAKGIYIPCADAYKTLSRHKGFHSVDFSTLVGKLTTRGMQVEVQSVANVLRELDRRLYN